MPTGQSVITIGNFDGVHIGHLALVKRAAELARPRGARVLAMAFDPHPLSRLRPGAEPARLTSFDQRERLLLDAGADEVIRLEPRDELLNLTPEEFVRTLLLPLKPSHVVEGGDFHFGKGRAGNVRVLADLGRALGFSTEVVPPVETALTDHQIVTASSTIARWLLTRGRVRDAAIVLGRPYEIRGTVVQGDQRGRTIGFPTANLDTDQLLPADGVYAGLAHVHDSVSSTARSVEAGVPAGVSVRSTSPRGAGVPPAPPASTSSCPSPARTFTAAINIGTRPTFNGRGRRLEAHLLDVPAGSLPGYGWILTIGLLGFVRDDMRFDSVDRLKDQIARDCRASREMVEDSRRPIAAGSAP